MNGAEEREENQAVRLAVALSRLRARLREEARASLNGFSITQIAILKRLRDGSAVTAASLAAAEYVTQQAIAQNLAGLKKQGLIRTETDPNDRRKSLIRLTEDGHRLIASFLASRDAWLVRAIEAAVPPDERADLDRAIQLLERLADAHTGPNTEIR